MKKKFTKERIRYWFDCMLSKGLAAMSILLFSVTAAIIGIIGIVAFFVSEDGGIIFQIWESFNYTLDPGNLLGVPTDNLPYLILMTLATMCGLFITSVLIGIITTGLEDKLNDLRKGTSVVQEDEHTVIVGFDGNIFSILNELIEANENKKDACIVVLGEQSKIDMEDSIASHIKDTKTTRIICRSGSLHEHHSLELCSIETCRSVIVNVYEDAEIVKVLLALSAYVKDKELVNPELRYVVSLQDMQHLEVAKIAGEGRAEIIFAKDAIARIIANTCRQHGLSQVLTEIFSFSGNELYFEKVPELVGKTLKESLLCFSNAIVCGIYYGDTVKLNPPMDTVIGPEDEVVLLELDDGEFKVHDVKQVEVPSVNQDHVQEMQTSNHLVVLGSNDKLPTILTEYDLYVKPGTQVLIVDDDFDANRLSEFKHLEVSICDKPINRALLSEFMEQNANNILLLNDDSTDPETSDTQSLLRLILLRDISDQTGKRLSITTEMRNVDNQRLASQARVDDFVIGSNFNSLLMAQISENPKIAPLIVDILDEDGSELYMKPASNYVQLGVEVDSYVLTESAARRGEIYIGYKCTEADAPKVVVNPEKTEKIVFAEGDQLIVIAED